jgi:hypothetical protein
MICNEIDWSATGSMLSGLATVAAVLVAYFQLSKVSQQMRETHEWNRRKTSQEVLNVLVFGEFPTLRTTVESELRCNIPDPKETYETKTATLSDSDKEKLDNSLRQILNILETIAINIKHNIVDEDICYDYLGWIMVEYHRWSFGFIDARRKKAGDSRVLISFSEYAERWQKRIASEKTNMVASTVVPAKAAL